MMFLMVSLYVEGICLRPEEKRDEICVRILSGITEKPFTSK